MRPEIEREIDRLGLRGQVQVTGWISNEAVRKHILDAAGAGAAQLRGRTCPWC